MKYKTVKRAIYTPHVIRARAQDYATRPEPSEMSKGRYGATVGELTNAVKMVMFPYIEDGEKRKYTKAENEMIAGSARLVLAWLFLDEHEQFDPMSRKELQPDKPQGPQMINALSQWMKEYKGEYPHGEWFFRPMFLDELTWVLYWANMAYRKTVDALSIGDELKFSEILSEYENQSVGAQDDHWDMTVLELVEPEQPPPAAELLPPDGAIWCEWCGDVYTTKGIPCKACQELGAAAGDTPIAAIESAPESPKIAVGSAGSYFDEL